MVKSASVDLITNQIPHTNMNGSFARTSNGEIHFTYCRSASRNETVLCRIRTADEGVSWTYPEKLPFLETPQDRSGTYFPNTSILTLRDGVTMIAYQRINASRNTGIFVRTSRDGGNTWSPESCVDVSHRGWYLVSNDRLLQTASGRILLPACCHTAMPLKEPQEVTADLSFFDHAINPYGMVQFFYSDDGGETWSAGSKALPVGVPASATGLQEPGVVCLRDGALMCYARTDLGRQYESFSIDDGENWSQPEPSALSSSCSTAIIHSAPGSQTLVAVWNPVPNYITLERDGLSIRQRLVCAFSDDMGARWREPILIEDNPSFEFSHPALFIGRDYLLISYNVMPVLHSRSFGIRIRRLPLP
ncbi:MAG: exo-alpha-sialidase [Clostridia bacterium]|nr:exo-alpha-sialidase [Clostridia bacterium]